MKKIFLLLSVVIGTFAFTACTVEDDGPDNDTISEVFELNVNLTQDNSGRFTALYPLDPPIYNSDVILVYRRTLDGNFTVWQPLPRTIFTGGGDEVDYDYNFTTDDLLLIADANYDLAETPQFTQNQTFRVVIVPGYFSQTVDVNDYDAVMSALSAQNGGDIQIEKR